ncbi:MAG: rhomboid family intramembrane serine protease [Candidatus Promineifilaceae bacterium]|nr:rhomboid family intramembrane serine protease [Candidatus Promineifilaceae bacterium]
MYRKTPIITLTLALIVSVVYLLRLINGEAAWEYLSARWFLFYNQPWRLVTSPFLHHDLPHVVINLVFLCLFGWQIERTQGWLKLLVLFFGALITAHFTFITVSHGWIVGISGGVCGLFGFSLIANRRVPWWKTVTHQPLHLIYSLFLVTPLIPFFASIIGYGVAHLNHLAGILYGMAFGSVFLLVPPNRLLRGAVIALPVLIFASLAYSPWQAEWRLVRRQPVLVTSDADCLLSSTAQDTYIPTNTIFENRSSRAVGLFWLDYEGTARFYSWIRAGSSSEEHSFIGNAWCVVDAANGEAIQAHIVSDLEETIIIP